MKINAHKLLSTVSRNKDRWQLCSFFYWISGASIHWSAANHRRVLTAHRQWVTDSLLAAGQTKTFL
jgi:hypothetical protein